MNNEQLATLANAGASNREIEATLGHYMTNAERLVVDRARVVARLRKQSKLKSGVVDAATRKKNQRERERAVIRRQCENPKRRIKYEKSAPAWLRFYMGENTYPEKWSEGHREIIHNAEFAAINGTGATSAAPRGEGKTTVLRGMAVNLLARKIVRFPVLAGWIKAQADEAFQRWLQMLAESPQFAADYPELTQPFEITTHNLALKNLTWFDTGHGIGAQIRTMHKIILLPDSLGAIASRSVQGDVKGLNATMPDGTVLRPDLLLLDDAQDPKQASNPDMVAKTVDKIENVFMGLSGPQKRMTTFCACTVEHESDVSEHFLNRKGWKSVRVSRILNWAGGSTGGDWGAKPTSKIRLLWDEWNRIRLDEGEPQCRKYYKTHKKALTKGMKVSWKQRFDKSRKEPDALYAAMLEYYDKGADVFARAQQNLPLKHDADLYDLNPRLIMSRVNDYEQNALPEWSSLLIASTDLNPSYAFTNALVAFGMDQTAAVITNGLYTGLDGKGICGGDATTHERQKKVFEALVIVGKQFASLPNKPELWLIDASGTDFDVVLRFCRESIKLCGIPAAGATGRSGRTYREYGRNVVGQPREGCYMSSDNKSRPPRKWLAWNTDYWREAAQRAWLGQVGAPGSLSIFAGGNHKDLAEQVCRETLKGKGDVGGQMFWNWHTQPGKHDYGDVIAQAYAGAAWNGIGIGGGNLIKKVAARKRTVRHIKV